MRTGKCRGTICTVRPVCAITDLFRYRTAIGNTGCVRRVRLSLLRSNRITTCTCVFVTHCYSRFTRDWCCAICAITDLFAVRCASCTGTVHQRIWCLGNGITTVGVFRANINLVRATRRTVLTRGTVCTVANGFRPNRVVITILCRQCCCASNFTFCNRCRTTICSISPRGTGCTNQRCQEIGLTSGITGFLPNIIGRFTVSARRPGGPTPDRERSDRVQRGTGHICSDEQCHQRTTAQKQSFSCIHACSFCLYTPPPRKFSFSLYCNTRCMYPHHQFLRFLSL